MIYRARMNINKLFRIFFCSASLLLFFAYLSTASELEISPPVYIAHAGGAINNEIYTNSLEALNSNYEKGHRFFEIDFSWTSDGELVAIHDWEETFQTMFDVPGDIPVPTKSEFILLKTKTGLTQLSLEDILKWAEKKGDAFIVTDIKDENIKALRKIRLDHKNQSQFVIPQVYSYKEYEEAKKHGYANIILTLYKMKIDPDKVVNFSKRNSPFAITMHWEVALSGLAYQLHKNGITVYTHTVNDSNIFPSLRKMGVFGIYTDFLSP